MASPSTTVSVSYLPSTYQPQQGDMFQLPPESEGLPSRNPNGTWRINLIRLDQISREKYLNLVTAKRIAFYVPSSNSICIAGSFFNEKTVHPEFWLCTRQNPNNVTFQSISAKLMRAPTDEAYQQFASRVAAGIRSVSQDERKDNSERGTAGRASTTTSTSTAATASNAAPGRAITPVPTSGSTSPRITITLTRNN